MLTCEKCKKTEGVVKNDHPKATFKCLCLNCVQQFLKQGSSDRIMFERLFKN
jgi:hypothetical protein